MRFIQVFWFFAFAALGAVDTASGANRNSRYTCDPAWPEGDQLFIDWVKLHVRFPNGSEMDMSDLNARHGFRIGEADTEISGQNTEVVTVREGGEPNRTCTAE